MRRLLLVLIATLAIAPAAHAWTWPADGRVLAPFSFDPANPYAAGQHRGLDIGGGSGEAVHAPVAGTVSFAGTVPGSGKAVTIETADGWSVTLTHLGQLGVKKDAVVAEGDTVGALADAGGADVPYVQLGVRRTADAQGYVDPLGLLPPRPAGAPPVPPEPSSAPAVPAASTPGVAVPPPDTTPAAVEPAQAAPPAPGVAPLAPATRASSPPALAPPEPAPLATPTAAAPDDPAP